MDVLDRITFDPNQFGGKPCLRGLRIPVSTILTLLRDHSHDEILTDYPELERADIDAALAYATYLTETRDVLVA
ncbi:MAG: DUF433 domain-containing protein [Deinococcota bacterium]